MAKYSKKAQDTIGDVMHRMKEGTLKSGSGDKVTNPKQAIAIGISEAKEKGYKTPPDPDKKKAAKNRELKRSNGRSKGLFRRGRYWQLKHHKYMLV